MAGNAALSNPAHVNLSTARGVVLDLPRQVASMPQTLWVSRRCGRLANRLVLAANLIAYAEQHGCRVVNFTLHSYAKHFQRLRNDWKCVYPSQGVPLMDRLPWITDWLRETRLCYRLVSLGRHVLPRMPFFRHRIQTVWEGDGVSPIDLEATGLLAKPREMPHVFIHGWEFRAPRALVKHGDKVRRYFLPHRRHRSASREVIDRLRSQGDLVVGVHVRHGDYRHWRRGKYYYPVAVTPRGCASFRLNSPHGGLSFWCAAMNRARAKSFPALRSVLGLATWWPTWTRSVVATI